MKSPLSVCRFMKIYPAIWFDRQIKKNMFCAIFIGLGKFLFDIFKVGGRA